MPKEDIYQTAKLRINSVIQNLFVYTYTMISGNSSIRSERSGFPILLHVNVFSVFSADNYSAVRNTTYSEVFSKARALIYIYGRECCFTCIFFCQLLKSWCKFLAMGGTTKLQVSKKPVLYGELCLSDQA
jgi:hypothetical protein